MADRGMAKSRLGRRYHLQADGEKEVKYVDVRFTDPRGKWQHTAITSR